MVSCFVESTFFLIQISFLVVQYVFNLTDVISLSLNDLVANFYTEIWSYFHVVHFEAIAFKLMLFLKKNFLLGVTLLMSWSEKYFSGFFFSNLNNGYLWPPPRVWKRCMYRYNRPPPPLSIPICPLLPFNVILEQMPFYAIQPLWPKSDEQFFFMENRTLDPMERWQCRSRDDIWISCEN